MNRTSGAGGGKSFQVGRSAHRYDLYVPSTVRAQNIHLLDRLILDTGVFRCMTAACVGDMLYGGVGCLRDYGEAMRYYLRAAHAGEAASANAVGLMHELGRGAVRNLEAAREWYERAADLG